MSRRGKSTGELIKQVYKFGNWDRLPEIADEAHKAWSRDYNQALRGLDMARNEHEVRAAGEALHSLNEKTFPTIAKLLDCIMDAIPGNPEHPRVWDWLNKWEDAMLKQTQAARRGQAVAMGRIIPGGLEGLQKALDHLLPQADLTPGRRE